MRKTRDLVVAISSDYRERALVKQREAFERTQLRLSLLVRKISDRSTQTDTLRSFSNPENTYEFVAYAWEFLRPHPFVIRVAVNCKWQWFSA